MVGCRRGGGGGWNWSESLDEVLRRSRDESLKARDCMEPRGPWGRERGCVRGGLVRETGRVHEETGREAV